MLIIIINIQLNYMINNIILKVIINNPTDRPYEKFISYLWITKKT